MIGPKTLALLIGDEAISAVEYAIMLSLISAALAAAMLAFGDAILNRYDTAATRVGGGG